MKIKYMRRRAVVLVLIIGAIWWANDATTPKKCKVPVEQMDQFCVDLMFP
jgi:hypothetical protein